MGPAGYAGACAEAVGAGGGGSGEIDAGTGRADQRSRIERAEARRCVEQQRYVARCGYDAGIAEQCGRIDDDVVGRIQLAQCDIAERGDRDIGWYGDYAALTAAAEAGGQRYNIDIAVGGDRTGSAAGQRADQRVAAAVRSKRPGNVAQIDAYVATCVNRRRSVSDSQRRQRHVGEGGEARIRSCAGGEDGDAALGAGHSQAAIGHGNAAAEDILFREQAGTIAGGDVAEADAVAGIDQDKGAVDIAKSGVARCRYGHIGPRLDQAGRRDDRACGDRHRLTGADGGEAQRIAGADRDIAVCIGQPELHCLNGGDRNIAARQYAAACWRRAATDAGQQFVAIDCDVAD